MDLDFEKLLEGVYEGNNPSSSNTIQDNQYIAPIENHQETLKLLDKAILNVNTKLEFNRKLEGIKKENEEKLEELIKILEQKQVEYSEVAILQTILKKYKEVKINQLQTNIENLINSTLSILLEDSLRLKFLSTETRGTMGIDLVFIDEEDNILNPDLCLGNSIRQITALLYSLAVVGYSGKSKVFIMDEVFTGLGERYSKLMSQIISELAQNGYQIVMVQHNSHLFSDEYCRLLYATKENNELCLTGVNQKEINTD